MENLDMTVNGHELVIKIDLSKRLGKSKSGKNFVIASTSGNISLPELPEIKLGLNCYTKQERQLVE